MDDVLGWFTSGGGSFDHSSVGFTEFPDCGRGAVALQDIPEGHVLFKIPRELLLSTDTSGLPQLIGLTCWKEKMSVGWVGLILCMMWETAQGSSSKWSKYLESLPTTFDTPMLWSDEDLGELKGTSVVDKLGKADAERDFKEKLLPLVESRPDIFPSETMPIYYTLEMFHVMGSRILSRSFDVEKDDPEETREDGAADTSLGSAMDVDAQQNEAEPADNEESETVPDGDPEEDDDEASGVSMIPLADMLNARYGSENAKLFYEKDALGMVSTKSIKAGEQLWNTYGDLPNAELLRRYGHVDMLPLPNGDVGNPGDIVEIRADIAVDVLHTAAKVTKERIDWWLEQGGDDVLVLETDLEIPLALVSLVRLLRLSPDEWEQAVAKDRVPKPKLDGEILAVVAAVLERRLSEYPTTLATDLELFCDETMPRNKKHALIVRIGEKRILQGAFNKVRAQMELEAQKANGSKKRKVPSDDEADRSSKTRRR
ncbi:SET domain-containing protein [Mycena pura]|uniref:Ribosomal lysine N-methyltransferase 4 n=1 Tax=Mycena pura TaxID=153505 RepID=A0AAD6YGT2_9AGAR|nr:SET domain-containing protein [Mycena pura]